MATASSHLTLLSDVHGDDADRKQVLIRVAYELLDESGLEGLTIRAVLSRAGLARRAFYECFQGKDDLVLAVFDSSLRAAALQFRDMTENCESPEEALRSIITGIVVGQMGYDHMGANRRGAALSREHLRLAQTRPEELQSALQPLLDLIAGLVSRGIAAGRFRKTDPQMQARLIYNLVSTTVHTMLLAEEGGIAEPIEREELAEDIWEFCRRGIVA
ncbi:TetR/AcrR family transcriptional regulator [Novosphingobium mangrovi (ex Huang et al. 2023)]|uniref:TetR/AcrR family transcriptional regulator n=1 Tax=Novosphingobium mangrovi (ex Huang et al. 2023) TaxID=2976432 RepID=A0ABT2I4U0_9SPHN|nr:TetR/AcrR family transcriptional regulator [Novosphingobium mangrovi (ex Huang et al. 2023)]MCT2399805.1 TetR/AcrR family transcriptional regulator [Novosphingobium mangrovi (ex Huang et al. 2023)]